MKKFVVTLVLLSVFFAFGCEKTDITETTLGRMADSTESLESENGTYPITLPLDPEVEQSILEASISEEESLSEEAARWNAVYEVMDDILNSQEFIEAETDEQKAEIVINAMKELSEHGTEKYPESLIIYDSWTYIPEYMEVDAKFFDGVDCIVTWIDFNKDSGSTVETSVG